MREVFWAVFYHRRTSSPHEDDEGRKRLVPSPTGHAVTKAFNAEETLVPASPPQHEANCTEADP